MGEDAEAWQWQQNSSDIYLLTTEAKCSRYGNIYRNPEEKKGKRKKKNFTKTTLDGVPPRL